MDLSQLSDEELRQLYAAKKAPKYDPTDDMSGMDTFRAGLGKFFYDTARGAGNIVTDAIPAAAKLGFATRADTDAAKARDEPLMNTGSGFAGNIVGNLIPAMFLRGATLPAAAGSGAGLGFTQQVGTKDSRTENTAIGGMFGAAVPLLASAARGVHAIAEPIFAPQRTAARILEQFADDPQALRLAAKSAPELVPGSKPTLAQAVQQPGISTLERGAMNQAGPAQAGLAERYLDQNGARVAAMKDLAGEGGKLDMYKASRSAVADELYSRAFSEVPGDTAWIKGEITKLMQRPAFVGALKDAQELALNTGIKVSPKNPENAPQLLHFTKMSLDDQIEAAVRAGNGNKSKALIDTRDKLVSLMESKDFSPSYREARDTFKQMSGPINEMETAGALKTKLVPALEDGADKPARLNANNFAAEVRKRQAEIDRFSPEGKRALEGVLQDLQRSSAAQGLGKAIGSPTAQNLTTQNVIRQIAGPLGLPESFAEKALTTPVIGSALKWGSKGVEQRVQHEMADFFLNPANAGDALDLIRRQGMFGRGMGKALPYLPGGMSASGLFALNRN